MANLLSNLLAPIQGFLNPQIPQPQPMQRGQSVSSSPGYIRPQAPPPQVDFGKIQGLLSQAGSALGGMIPRNPLANPMISSRNMPAPSMTPAPLLSQPTAKPMATMAPQMGGGRAVDPKIEAIATPIFEKYGIPLSVAYGQFAQEGRGKHKYAQAPYNNPFNIGAYDRNPDNAIRYPSLEKGIEAYAKLLSGKYELGHIGSGRFDKKYEKAYSKRDNEEEMLKLIAQIGYASDPNYFNSITNTPEYRHYKGRKK